MVLRFVFVLVAMVGLASVSLGEDRRSYTVKDRQGRIVQTVKVQGNRLTFLDSRGRYDGSATIRGKNITMFDRQGRRK